MGYETFIELEKLERHEIYKKQGDTYDINITIRFNLTYCQHIIITYYISIVSQVCGLINHGSTTR